MCDFPLLGSIADFSSSYHVHFRFLPPPSPQQKKDWYSLFCLRYSFQFPPARETYFTHLRHKSMNGPKTVSSGGDPILQQIQSPSVPFKCNSMQIQMNESISGGCCFQRGSRKSWTFLRATTERQPQGIKISSPIISMSAGTLCRIIADPIYESLFDNCIDLPLDSLRSLWPESSWGMKWRRKGNGRQGQPFSHCLFVVACWLLVHGNLSHHFVLISVV